MLRRCSALLVFAALAVPASAAADCPGAKAEPTAQTIRQAADATLCLLNAERQTAGLGALTERADLTKASTDFSALMVEKRFFAHVTPGGTTLSQRLTTAGYLTGATSWSVGENIAWGESYLATPAEIVDAWMHSDGHRANILNGSFEDIGLGIVLGTPSTDNPGATYTTDFGRRRGDFPATQTGGDVTVGTGPTATTTTPVNRAASKTTAKKKAVRRSCRRVTRRTSKGRKVTRVTCKIVKRTAAKRTTAKR